MGGVRRDHLLRAKSSILKNAKAPLGTRYHDTFSQPKIGFRHVKQDILWPLQGSAFECNGSKFCSQMLLPPTRYERF